MLVSIRHELLRPAGVTLKWHKLSEKLSGKMFQDPSYIHGLWPRIPFPEVHYKTIRNMRRLMQKYIQ